MAYTTIAQFIVALNSYATSKGLSANRPISINFKNAATNYETLRVIVSFTEPFGVEAPLNLLWLVADNASPNFNKVLRRNTRTPNNGYQHTWVEVADMNTVYQTQAWDIPIPTNIKERDHVDEVGNPHKTTAEDISALATTGGTMSGPLHLRPAPTAPAQYANTEAVPRSWIDALVTPVRTLANQVKALQTNLNNQFGNLRNRVVILEASMLGVRVKILNVTEPTLVWVFAHNFNKPNIMVEVYNDNSELVIPGTVKVIDPNTVQVEFAEPVTGRLEVTPKAVF